MFAESPRPRQELAIEAFSHFEIVHRSILESKRMLQIDVLVRALGTSLRARSLRVSLARFHPRLVAATAEREAAKLRGPGDQAAMAFRSDSWRQSRPLFPGHRDLR